MKISDNGLELIKKFEGCKLTAYRDPAGILTIGYGHTRGVKEGQKITKKKADELLRDDVAFAESHVNGYLRKYKFTQNEFDALVSFAYNIGSINQLTKNGKRNKGVIADKMLLYTKAGGKQLSGLVKRRRAEHDLFVS